MAKTKVNILDLQKKTDDSEPITMLTAYDYSSASLVDAAEIDMILVGDSLGMVVLGYDSTVPVTMEEMLHHCKAVARGAKRAFLVGDMPFMSYQAEIGEAVHNAGRFLKEGGMDSVKLEGGQEVVPAIEAILTAGIPVLGHIGLTPQSQSKLGGYRVQGRTAVSAAKLLEDALALESAGCFGIVLEAIPATVAQVISSHLHIPTIGIGAGAGCSGQVLVFHDVLGLYDRLQPRFVKEYAALRQTIIDAFVAFGSDVRSSQFPAQEHTYGMKAEEEVEFLGSLAE
ncbi:MAG: 3-methyl-2-oxobutanoate hydroxymethyltransferase [Chloroflexi bacterium]|jgi:3-methyl-2-oxobutanoate hydroxymethyltransferase|nr:3-methyl-2-oxobutanoate hydroxymethyltransferase [Chloroflexota bacterium]